MLQMEAAHGRGDGSTKPLHESSEAAEAKLFLCLPWMLIRLSWQWCLCSLCYLLAFPPLCQAQECWYHCSNET